jgi:hypothetical protein
MISRSGRRSVARAAVVSCAALSGGVLFASAAAAAGPNATATPDKYLTNNTVVTVRASGYTPGATVSIVECNRKFAIGGGAPSCDISGGITAAVTAGGKVPATGFTVKTGTIGNGKCTASRRPTAANSCFIIVTNSSNTKQVAGVNILFEPR